MHCVRDDAPVRDRPSMPRREGCSRTGGRKLGRAGRVLWVVDETRLEGRVFAEAADPDRLRELMVLVDSFAVCSWTLAAGIGALGIVSKDGAVR